MLATRRRGLSADCGSWNTICKLMARSAALRVVASVRFSPLSRMCPFVGCSRPTRSFAMVLLPLPLSPTSADKFILGDHETCAFDRTDDTPTAEHATAGRIVFLETFNLQDQPLGNSRRRRKLLRRPDVGRSLGVDTGGVAAGGKHQGWRLDAPAIRCDQRTSRCESGNPTCPASWLKLGICSGMTYSARRSARIDGLASCRHRV